MSPPPDHSHRHDRHYREGQQRQAPVGEEHHPDDAGQDQDIAHDPDQAVGEHVVDDAHIVLQAGHDRPDPAPVDVPDTQPLQVPEEGRAQIEDDPLADPGRQVRLAVIGAEPEQDGGKEDGHQEIERRNSGTPEESPAGVRIDDVQPEPEEVG